MQRGLRSRARLVVPATVSCERDFLVRSYEDRPSGMVSPDGCSAPWVYLRAKKELSLSAVRANMARVSTIGFRRRAFGAEIGIHLVRFVMTTINRVGSADSVAIRVARAAIIHRLLINRDPSTSLPEGCCTGDGDRVPDAAQERSM